MAALRRRARPRPARVGVPGRGWEGSGTQRCPGDRALAWLRRESCEQRGVVSEGRGRASEKRVEKGGFGGKSPPFSSGWT